MIELGKRPVLSEELSAYLSDKYSSIKYTYLAFGQSNVVHGIIDQPIIESATSANIGNFVYSDLPLGEVKVKPLGTHITWIDPAFKRAPFHTKLSRLLSNVFGGQVDTAVSYKGSTGFTTGEWLANGQQMKNLKVLITDLIKNKGYKILFAVWIQGERDFAFAHQYQHWLDAMAEQVRVLVKQAGQEDGLTMPFITGRMHPDSLARPVPEAGGAEVDNALFTVGTRVSNSHGTDLLGMPDRAGIGDDRHFTGIQNQFLADKYFEAYFNAKNNVFDDQLPPGEYLLFKGTGGDAGRIGNALDIMSGGDVNAFLTTDFWKLRKCKNDKGYRIRVEVDMTISGLTESIEFYQKEHPLFALSGETQTQVISVTSGFYFGDKGQMFNGLVQTSASPMFSLADSSSGWSPIGQVTPHVSTGIPWYKDGATEMIALSVRVYAIKE